MGSKYGMFSEPGYISVGDPYPEFPKISKRLTGLNFKATKINKNKSMTNDTRFEPLKPLWQKEPYELSNEEAKAARAARLAAAAATTPFRPPMLGKKSSGLGTYDGHLGPKHAHMQDYDTDRIIKKKGMFPDKPRQIITNPPKKGTYGFNTTTLGERLGKGGAVGEYAYVPSPYDADRKAKYEELLKGKEKQPTDKAFRPPNPSKKGGYGFAGTTLGGKGPGVLGEYAYKEHGHRDKEPPPPSFPVPFRPSAPGKKGYNCTMTPFAKHVADPQEIRQMQEKEARMAEIKRRASGAPFRPCTITKQLATPSVLKKNIVTGFKSSMAAAGR